MNATVTIPRELVESLLHYARYLADSSLAIAENNIRLEGAIIGTEALLAQPQPDRVKVLEDALRHIKGYVEAFDVPLAYFGDKDQFEIVETCREALEGPKESA